MPTASSEAVDIATRPECSRVPDGDVRRLDTPRSRGHTDEISMAESSSTRLIGNLACRERIDNKPGRNVASIHSFDVAFSATAGARPTHASGSMSRGATLDLRRPTRGRRTRRGPGGHLACVPMAWRVGSSDRLGRVRVPSPGRRFHTPPGPVGLHEGRCREGVWLMSIDKSLKKAGSMARSRNVLTRAERLVILQDDERWTPALGVYNLPKTKYRRLPRASRARGGSSPRPDPGRMCGPSPASGRSMEASPPARRPGVFRLRSTPGGTVQRSVGKVPISVANSKSRSVRPPSECVDSSSRTVR